MQELWDAMEPLSFGIRTFNEAATLGAVIGAIPEVYCPDFIVGDAQSTDGTQVDARETGARVNGISSTSYLRGAGNATGI